MSNYYGPNPLLADNVRRSPQPSPINIPHVRTAIVEDHHMTRDFVVRVCSTDPEIEIVGVCATGSEAVDLIVYQKPEVVILDIGLPDFDGFEVLRRIRQYALHPRILAISATCSTYLDFRIEQAGIQGFVDKREQTAQSLREAICSFKVNRSYFAKSLLAIRDKRMRDPYSFHKILSDQQILVLGLLSHFVPDDAIAARLEISECTVTTHRSGIMRKLGLHSRTDLISFANINGFTSCMPELGAFSKSKRILKDEFKSSGMGPDWIKAVSV